MTIPALGNPVRGTIRPTGWKRPPGNTDYRLTRGFVGQEPAHDGLDIGNGRFGGDICAAYLGVIVKASLEDPPWDKSLNIVIDHGTFRTRYGHCRDEVVSVGQSVTQGKVIGHVGATGMADGPHVHFEVELESTGRKVDAWPLLAQNQPRAVHPRNLEDIQIRTGPGREFRTFAATRKGRIVRTSDGLDLGPWNGTYRYGGTVDEGEYEWPTGNPRFDWDRIRIPNETGKPYRYLASALAVRS